MLMLRLDDVRRRVGLSRSTIWRLERSGQFVPRRRLSANAVGWPEDEIDEWLRTRGCAAAGAGDAPSTPPDATAAKSSAESVRRTRRGSRP